MSITKDLCFYAKPWRRAAAFLAAFALVFVFFATSLFAATAYTGQTETDAYTISTAAQLAKLAQTVNDGTPYAGSTFTLTADIDFAQSDSYEALSWTGGTNWTPIGNTSSIVFSGVFDGGGFLLKNICVNATTVYAGLFGNSTGTIENVIIKSGSFESNQAGLGAIAGKSTGTITNCINRASVTNTKTSSSAVTGGIAGQTSGIVSHCANTGTVTATGGASTIGGIVGQSSGSTLTCTISNCYNTGLINVLENKMAGGIIGYVNAGTNTIENCYNAGNVTPATGNGAVYAKNNNRTLVLTNNYFLRTSAVNSDFSAETGITAVSEAELQAAAMLTSLGAAYQADLSPNINGGYPVLAWQLASSGPEVVVTDKAALQAAIDLVTGANAANYYQSGDRWNGKTAKTNGFWASMLPYLTAAQSVNASPSSTQAQVDDAAAALQAAIANLISTENVNATALYETVESAKTLYLRDSSEYTEDSWAAFAAQLIESEDLLASLYVQDEGETKGNPTAINQASYQGTVDASAADLAAAMDELVYEVSFNNMKNAATIAYDSISVVAGLFDPAKMTAGDYTEASWQAFTAARTEIMAAYAAGIPQGGTAAAMEGLTALVCEYEAFWEACYWGLESAGNSVTVSLEIVDAAGTFHPEYAMAGANNGSGYYNSALTVPKSDKTYDGENNLIDNNFSVEDALSAAGITLDSTMAYTTDIYNWSFSVQYAVFINDVLYRGFSGEIYDTSSTYVSFGGTLSADRALVNLRDGDEVRIVRMEQAFATYYISWQIVTYNYLLDHIADLRFAGEEDGVITATAGEPVDLAVERALSSPSEYNGIYNPATSISLYYSAASAENPDGISLPALTDSGVNSDSAGNASLTFYEAGWYTVAAVDDRENDLADVEVYGSITGGTYYSLQSPATVRVYVAEATEESLAAYIETYLGNLEEAFNGYDANDYTSANWKSLNKAYNRGVADIQYAVTLAEAKEGVDTGLAAMAAVEAIDHAGILADFRTLLATVGGAVDSNDKDKIAPVLAAYDALSEYQRSLLLPAETTLITELQNCDPDNLPAPAAHSFTVVTVPAEAAATELPEGATSVFEFNSTTTYAAISEAMEGDRILSKFTGDASGNSGAGFNDYTAVYIEMTPNVVDTVSNRNITQEFFNIDGTFAGSNNFFQFDMPDEDVTVTIYYEANDELAIKSEKTHALNQVANAYISYQKYKYTAANWTALSKIRTDALAEITAITAPKDDEAAIAQAKTDLAQAAAAAVAAMAAIPQRGADDLGSVTVEIYNTTYADGPWYNATEPFVSETVALTSSDTMMTAALKALNSEGYTWVGTGGAASDPYSITYLSSIAKDSLLGGSQSLTEFDNGGKSGWMGTLNDWFVDEGFNSKSVRDGDVIRVMYTSAGYGEDIGGSWYNSDTSLKNLSVEGGTLTPVFDGDTLSYVLLLDEGVDSVTVTPEAANKNYLVRQFLNTYTSTISDAVNYYRPGEEIPVTGGDVVYIGVGENAWPSMNKTGSEARDYTPTKYTIYILDADTDASYVIDTIYRLPALSTITLADESTIAGVRALYEVLDETGKAAVTNYATLTAAEERIADLQEVENVKAMIQALPAAADVRVTHADAIHAADAAYNALTAIQKNTILAMYTNKLTAVKNALDNLGYVAPADYEEALANVLSYIQTTVTNPTCGSTEGEWAVLDLARGNAENDTIAAWKELYLANIKADVASKEGKMSCSGSPGNYRLTDYKYTEFSRVILALTALGVDASAFDTGSGVYDLVTPLTTTNADGEYYPMLQGNNSIAFALIALDTANYLPNGAKVARAAYIDALKANQGEDGGWPISSGTPGFGVDVTAMVIQALAPYYNDQAKFEALEADTTYAELQTMVDDAVDCIKTYGTSNFGSVEASAQVLVALVSIGVNPEAEATGWAVVSDIMTYLDESTGGFRHVNESGATVNQMATEQAAYALVAYDRYVNDANTLYDMTDVFTAAEDASYKADADAVTAQISALPTATNVQLGDEAAIVAAREAFDALTETQKDLVSSATLLKLMNAETALATLKAGEADLSAANAVTAAIDALPAAADVTLGNKTAVNNAKAAYDALTATQKALITAAALQKLTDCVDKIADLGGSSPAIEDMKDVPTTGWFYEDVSFVLSEGIMKGTSNTSFEPNAQITRGQFVTILGRYAGVEDSSAAAPTATAFGDVSSSAYYAAHVAWAVANGVTNGTGGATFSPNAPITREDMATMIYRYAEVMEITLPDGADAEAFADDASIASYAKTAVYSMKEAAIISGKGNNLFDPKGNATRAEAAKIIRLLLELQG